MAPAATDPEYAPSLDHVSFVEVQASCIPPKEHAKLRAMVPVLNNQAVTHLNAGFQPPMNATVRQAIQRFVDEATTEPNPKAKWQQRTASAREKLAKHLCVEPKSIAFTRDTTEGLNLFQRSLRFQPGDNVVILDVEHPNHAYGWLALVESGLEVRRVPTEGAVFANAGTFAPFVDGRTVAIGLSSVMFHSGQLNDVRDVAIQFRPRGVHVLADLTQQIGAARINLKSLNVSAAAFGFHKALGCPSGLGGLYVDPQALSTLKSAPPIVGAGAILNLQSDLVAIPDVQYHESTLRYEHLNLSLVGTTALDAALDLLENMNVDRVEQHYRALGRELARGCAKIGVEIVGSSKTNERAAHVYILRLLDPAWQEHFKAAGVYVSHYRCGVRVSFGFYNNLADVHTLLDVLMQGLANGIPCE
ncbi:Aminotransferase class-V-like protein 2 [Elsinoe fawcettii]|nr:Aminotransferase class-V-like protein 2 [Elsinoe fawcettii]